MMFLEDTFTEPELTQLADHDPDTGGTWEELDFTTSDLAPDTETVIFENVLQTRPSLGIRGAAHRNTVDPGSDEYDIEVHLSLGDGAQTSRYHAILWRMTPTGTSDADVDRYMMVADANFEQWELYKTIGGSDNRVTLDTVSDPTIPNSEFDVRVEVRTTQMRVYVDDVLTLSSGDTQITQRGRVGVICGRGDEASGNWLDDLVCTAITNPGAVDLFVVDSGGDEQSVDAYVLHNGIERPTAWSVVTP